MKENYNKFQDFIFNFSCMISAIYLIFFLFTAYKKEINLNDIAFAMLSFYFLIVWEIRNIKIKKNENTIINTKTQTRFNRNNP